MKPYIIHYHLHDHSRDYEKLQGVIERVYPTHLYVRRSVLVIITDHVALTIAASLAQIVISPEDELFVAHLAGDWNGSNLPAVAIEWLNLHLSQQLAIAYSPQA